MAQLIEAQNPIPIPFLLVDENDDETPMDSVDVGTIVIEYRKEGESVFTPFTNTPVNITKGWYTVLPTTTEIDTLGNFLIDATAPGCDIWRDVWGVVKEIPGGGSVPITQHYGGTNVLAAKLESDGSFVDGVRITVYLKSDYDAYNLDDNFVQDRTVTRGDGSWMSPLMLASGNTYTFVYEGHIIDTKIVEVTIS